MLTKEQKIKQTQVTTTQKNKGGNGVGASRNVQITCGICQTIFPVCGVASLKIETKCSGCKTELTVWLK